MNKATRKIGIFLAVSILLLTAFLVGNMGYYAGSSVSGKFCTSCHQIKPAYDHWEQSSHRNFDCKACHGSSFTLDLRFHSDNLRRLASQFQGAIPDQILLKDSQVDAIVERCRSCHTNKYSLWKASGHSMTYSHVYLDAKHNRKDLLVEDCARCHGMFFEGTVAAVVEPLNREGPWKLTDSSLASRPAIPCLACHQMHSQGHPAQSPQYSKPDSIAHSRTITSASLAFYDRREKRYFAPSSLPIPAMLDAGRPVVMSPDLRQRVCYQCHAPEVTLEVRSGDDRTCIGVHEGIGCLGCHEAHSQDARASCANCHPRLSNCGLNVETMDTTFKSSDSRHNLHFVKCADCHTKGVPKVKTKKV